MRLQGVAEHLPALVDAQLRSESGLSRYEYLVLDMLAETPGGTRLMSELAAVTNGSLSRLSHAASRLEQNGWITRAPVENNRRATAATLTQAGWDKLAASAPGHVETVQSVLFDHLSPEQLTALSRALIPIATALGVPEIDEETGTCPG